MNSVACLGVIQTDPCRRSGPFRCGSRAMDADCGTRMKMLRERTAQRVVTMRHIHHNGQELLLSHILHVLSVSSNIADDIVDVLVGVSFAATSKRRVLVGDTSNHAEY